MMLKVVPVIPVPLKLMVVLIKELEIPGLEVLEVLEVLMLVLEHPEGVHP
jgi:hypothetical protein